MRMASGSRRNDVLLVFPGRYKAPDPQVPLQLLHVAGALQRAGYRVRIVDMRLQDHRTYPIGDPVFVGITCMSGPQIRYGLEFARRVRAERPGCPIVWGGVHPTLLPEQTAASECRGRGGPRRGRAWSWPPWPTGWPPANRWTTCTA